MVLLSFEFPDEHAVLMCVVVQFVVISHSLSPSLICSHHSEG